MHLLERRSIVPASLEDVFGFFCDPANLARITPPSLHFRIVEAPDRRLRAGDRIRYTIRLLGLPVGWTTRITAWEELRSFSDTQEKGPYRSWNHTHGFREVPGGVEMTDRVEYELPFGPIGRLAHALWVRTELGRIFDFREAVIGQLFAKSPAR
jgi:ligand-binding SRPBCC domain-containing protein